MSEPINPRETGDWSVETLFAHLTALLNEMDRRYEARAIEADRRYEQRFLAQQEAISKQERSAEEWRRGANEWRDAMTDREIRFMPRAEAEARDRQSDDKIDALTKKVTESFSVVNSRLDLMAGRSRGLGDSWGLLVGAVGLVGGVIAIVLGLR